MKNVYPLLLRMSERRPCDAENTLEKAEKNI
jgi:hypothetical protein